VHVDEDADVPVGPSIRGEEHDPRPLRHPCFDRPRSAPRLEDTTVTVSQLQWR
jgi:hypothetical protein